MKIHRLLGRIACGPAFGALVLACGGSGGSTAESDLSAPSAGKTATGSFERREKIHVVDGVGFDRTIVDPTTGIIRGAHPEKFVVEGTTVFTTKDFATGAKDKPCGSMKIGSDAVEFTGTCGLASFYANDPSSKGSFERRESIHVVDGGGFDRTIVDPTTGIIRGAHPEKFVVEGTTVFTTKDFATGAKDKPCGTIKFGSDVVEFSGTCDLASFYDKQLPPPAAAGSFERRESIHVVDGVGFDRTIVDPTTGIIRGAHPEKFVVEGTTVFTTKDFATGAKDRACGAIKIGSDAVEFTGTCDLASSYDKDPTSKGSFARRESIHVVDGVGFDRTIVDPTTGIIRGAHPEKFVVEGTTVFTTKDFATGAKDKACGSIKIGSDAVVFTGTCDLASSYERRK